MLTTIIGIFYVQTGTPSISNGVTLGYLLETYWWPNFGFLILACPTLQFLKRAKLVSLVHQANKHKSNVFIQRGLTSEKCAIESRYANDRVPQLASINLARDCDTEYGGRGRLSRKFKQVAVPPVSQAELLYYQFSLFC